jgi:hypothetical protein
VGFALQEAKLSVNRLRTLLFGKGSTPPKPPVSDASSTLSEAVEEGESGEASLLCAEETTGAAAGSGSEESQTDTRAKPRGGHREGTGRLGADAYEGAEKVEGRHEALAVGPRCPVCGRGTLYA